MKRVECKDLGFFIGAIKSAVDIINRNGHAALNSPRSDGYFQYYQSVDSGLTFLIEWLEEVQTEEQPQDKEK